MKNKEFWKGAVAGALVVTCIGTGAFAGTGLAAKGTALGDRKCTSMAFSTFCSSLCSKNRPHFV